MGLRSYECWLEKTENGNYFVLLRVSVDGKRNSIPIKINKQWTFLEFDVAAKDKNNVFDVGKYRDVPWYVYFVPKYGPFVHWFRLKSFPSADIEIKLVTKKTALTYSGYEYFPNETTLKFDLTSANNSDSQ